MSKPFKKLHVAALSILVKSGAEIQLLPAGEFRARDGRPEKIGSWNCSAEIAKGVIALAAARQTPLVIDYEHQTLLSEKNGQPAPAAGWFKTLEWREGDGLYATDVEWTDKARAMIEAKEYLYLSPVFSFDPSTGAVLQINHAALTNVPALDGMAEVAVMSAYAHRFSDQPNHEEPDMDLLKKLLTAIGLAETTTETEALAAVAALKTKAEQSGALESQVAALKTANPDPAKFVSVETMNALQGQVAALSTKLNTQELDTVITDALTAGKLLPPQEAWARELGGKDMVSLKSYLANAVAIAPSKQQTDGKENGASTGDGKLSAEEQAVCKQMGLSEEAFLKTKATS